MISLETAQYFNRMQRLESNNHRLRVVLRAAYEALNKQSLPVAEHQKLLQTMEACIWEARP